MCCLFGLLDYKEVFNKRDKNAIISVLSIKCEERGTDATGIAYNENGRLCIYKRPLPAHKLRYSIPNSTRYIMGHTRMTTQGSEKHNYNNHPFLGSVLSEKFALAHNGVIYNDNKLRKSELLPKTKIQTDSYIATQLIEQQNTLNFESMKYMAEKVEGSFVFTVINNSDNLYIVKGNNPFCLYHFPQSGFYLYASANEILTKAIIKLNMHSWQKENVLIKHGDILKIDKQGNINRGSFNALELYYGFGYKRHSTYQNKPAYQKMPTHQKRCSQVKNASNNNYLQDLKSIAIYYSYCSNDIDDLLEDGFSCEEIEEMLYFYAF